MEKVLFLLTLILGSNAIFIDDKVSNRISNGHESSITEFAYSVSIQQLALAGTPTRGHKCGGAAITLQHILTAAICAHNFVNGSYMQMNASEFRIFTGASFLTADTDPNTFIRNVANITVHPQYIPPPASLNDIAVFTLVLPFSNSIVRPIALPTPDFAPADFTLCTIASWGAQLYNETATNTLRATFKYVYNQNLCKTLYNQVAGNLNIFPSMICAASYDIISSGCNGDQGIALVCMGGLAGIMFKTNECFPSSYPEIYTRVSNYTDWIREISGTANFRSELTLFGIIAIVFSKLISKV